MFTDKELNSNCVISSERGLQTSRLGSLILSDNMTRVDAMWWGKPVSCAYFPKTAKTWRNAAASMIVGQPIFGNAVLLGVQSEEIARAQAQPRAWANVASLLPKTVSLDEVAIARIAQEQADRDAAWSNYKQRRLSRRRGVNRDTATIDLSSGEVIAELTPEEQASQDAADAAFATWAIDEEFTTVED